MKKFIVTSPKFEGTIVFAYNSNGTLITYINDTDLNEEGLTWMLSYMPMQLKDVTWLKNKIEGKIEEVPADISFDAFWNAYDQKINRKRAELLYKKLEETEKLLCIMAIKPYKRYCQMKNRGIADPEKYIYQKYFETDWRGLK